MKHLKAFAITGIVISGFGILGSFSLLFQGAPGWLIALLVYGYFLFQSIYTLKKI